MLSNLLITERYLQLSLCFALTQWLSTHSAAQASLELAVPWLQPAEWLTQRCVLRPG